MPFLNLEVSKAVVGELVHEAVEEGLGAARVHSELPIGCEVVSLLWAEW